MLWQFLDVLVLIFYPFIIFILTEGYKRIIFSNIMNEFVTVNHKNKYYCECCELESGTKQNYLRHLKTRKHEQIWKKSILLEQKNELFIQTKELLLQTDNKKHPEPIINNYSNVVTPIQQCEKQKKIETRFVCECCQFSTTKKKESNKHRTSKQHVNNENKIEDFIEINTQYVCLSCSKTFKKYKNCWEHLKRCEGKKENIVLEIVDKNVTPEPMICEKSPHSEMISKDLLKEVCEILVNKLTENNQMNQNTLVKMVETITQNQQALLGTMTQTQQSLMLSNTNHTNNIQISNSTNNSNNNNHCTINMFLNEKCKDAMNITDWAKQLHIDYDHLYYTGENGFQKGLTNMLVENLKLCDVYNRPIHFTDVKRDRMYIRDADEWTKHENTDKLNEVLEISARQACVRLTDWMKEHENVPDYHDLDSELGQQYLALMVSVIRPQVEREKAFPKVIKELAKTAQLKKEDQV